MPSRFDPVCNVNMATMATFALCLLMTRANFVIGSELKLELDVDPFVAFDISIDGVRWFQNQGIWFRHEGTTFVAPGSQNLSLPQPIQFLAASPVQTTAGKDAFGDFNRVAVTWSGGGTEMVTSIRNYSGGKLIFAQEFPLGLSNASTGDMNGISSGFPSFHPSTIGDGKDISVERRWMGYNGWDCFDLYGCVSSQAQRVALGVWNNATTVLPYGLEGSGPLAIMAPDGSRTVVISAANSFMAVSQQLISFDTTQNTSLSSFNETRGFCVASKEYSYTANNISLEECFQKCLENDCDAFDYAPGWPRPQTYCENCRIQSKQMSYTTNPSNQNYTAYVRKNVGQQAGALSWGLSGKIENVPKGFSVETILSLGAGPNQAVRQWGDVMTRRYNKSNPRDKDYTTTHLGYATDNGAYYYKNPEPGKTYQQTLFDVKNYADEQKIPYRHVQLDSWWYIKGVGGGTKTWAPGPGTFPDGLAPFSNKTGWKITAHNRMWAADTTYAVANGGDYKWYLEGDEAVPLEQDFWNFLLNQGKHWGLSVYEQDWMFTEFVGTNKTLADPELARTWLLQMGSAATAEDLTIQYCMLWPRMALQSLEIPSVTTARASTDYDAGRNDQWILGLSSLFLDSLALRPTKDNFFSTDKQGNGSKGTERFNRLQALVSVLTTGPVFPSDKVGASDAALILRACTTDGRTLRPDSAATNIDSNILAKALARGTGVAEPGEVQSTYTVFGGERYHHVLVVNAINSTTATTITTVGLNITDNKYLAFESNTSSRVVPFDHDHPLDIPITDRWSFQYHTVVPPLSNGIYFLGEAQDKWVSVSPDRFSNVSVGATTVTMTASGKPGETIRLSWVAPALSSSPPSPSSPSLLSSSVAAPHTVDTLECTIGSEGTLTIVLPSKTC
eukprot:m.18491 g.18491  ORF g.18491 m.18491 type:complete len:900 (-) comp12048_c0_seq1:37-2736(-)